MRQVASTAVENEREYYNCHQPAESINGLVVVDFSISDVKRQVLTDWQEVLLLSAAAVAIAAVATWLVLRRTVLARLKELMETCAGYLTHPPLWKKWSGPS